MKNTQRENPRHTVWIALGGILAVLFACSVAMAFQQLESNAPRVRKIEPPANQSPAPASIRTIPVQDAATPTTSVPPANPPAYSLPNASELQLVKIAAVPKTEDNATPAPLRVLSSTAKPVQRVDAGNPLHRMPHGGGLIDPIADVPSIAALPSYSAVASSPMPRIDQPQVPVPPNNTPPNTPSQNTYSIEIIANPKPQPPEVARRSTPLPVQDIDVLRSPSHVVTRQGQPMAKNTSSASQPNASIAIYDREQFAASHRPQRSAAATPPSAIPMDNTIAFQSDRRFVSTTSPDVLQFGVIEKNPPVVVAEQTDPFSGHLPHHMPHHLPQMASQIPAEPRAELIGFTTLAPEIAFTGAFPMMTEFPMFNEARNGEPQSPMQIAAVPEDSFPIANNVAANDDVASRPSFFGEVVLPQFALPDAALPDVVLNDVVPVEVAKADVSPQTLPPSLPHLPPVNSIPSHLPAPSAVAALPDQRMPPIPIQSQPMPSATPMDPHFLAEHHRQPPPNYVLPEPLPRPASPPVLASMPLPIDAPRLADARTEPPRVQPPHDEKTGFASTRRTESPAPASPSAPTGFARSRQ